jgi:uroporphyrin-III C-methyltransferase/precorrin-2 dehydrogenase/sirohydrochlorin ferrochelatase
MKYFPVFIDLVGKKVLIVGGGQVALRRARQLLAAEARVTLVAPLVLAEFRDLVGVDLVERPVEITDVSKDYCMVIVATDNERVNAMVSDICEKLGILCNRCDNFREGSFVCGCSLLREPLVCTVMAGGVPEMAKYLSARIDKLLSPSLLALAGLLVELRPAIKAARPGEVGTFIARLVNDETLARIEREGISSLREEILACL